MNASASALAYLQTNMEDYKKYDSAGISSIAADRRESSIIAGLIHFNSGKSTLTLYVDEDKIMMFGYVCMAYQRLVDIDLLLKAVHQFPYGGLMALPEASSVHHELNYGCTTSLSSLDDSIWHRMYQIRETSFALAKAWILGDFHRS